MKMVGFSSRKGSPPRVGRQLGKASAEQLWGTLRVLEDFAVLPGVCPSGPRWPGRPGLRK